MSLPPNPPHVAPPREYTIDELAREGESTVRNIRAYQERGLLPPPERRGRVGIYTDAHLARLRMINGLLMRGYSMSNILEMCRAWEQGHDLAQLLGLESALTAPFTDEAPAYHTTEELLAMFEGKFSLAAIESAVELEIIVPEKERFKVPSPRLLHVGVELSRVGIPIEEMLEILRLLRANVDAAARGIVSRVATWVFDARYGSSLPPPEDAAELASVVWRLRPLVDMAVSAEAARAMRIALADILGDRLKKIFEHVALEDADQASAAASGERSR